MSTVTSSAPGKVVISGEYAVLDGAPAIATAVSPRARVSVRSSTGRQHTVTSEHYENVQGEFRCDAGKFEWLAGGDAYAIVEHAWHASRFATSTAVAIDIDTSEFFDRASNTKLGLGSSAALMTALTAALLVQSGADVAAIAQMAHRDFQQGVGSGVDVACSSTGGLLQFRIVDPQPTPVPWPAGLEYAFFWSGVPASTTARLRNLSQQAPKPSRLALDEAAVAAASAWAAGSAPAVVAEMHRYTGILRRFSIDHDLGIFDAGHAGLLTDMDDNLVYKPCGAGGGDIGMALSTSGDALAEFVDRAAAAGFVRLDIGIEPQGYQVAREYE